MFHLHTRNLLARDFRALGVAPGDTVMLHASIRSVGEVAGGPDQIHLALKDALTEDGTLVMYASCPRYADEIGRGNLTAEQEAELKAKLPPFNPLRDRSARDNGALVELLRTYPGSRVNLHPARFVVWGAGADHLLEPQPWDFAFGRGSLLERFLERDGKILLLGCDHDTVTFLHYAEHTLEFPHNKTARFLVHVREGEWREMAEVDTSGEAAPDRLFAHIVEAHLESTGNVGGRVGDSQSYLIGARALYEEAVRWSCRPAGPPRA